MCFQFSNRENMTAATNREFYKSKFKHGWNLTLFEVFQVTLIRFILLAERNCLVIIKD